MNVATDRSLVWLRQALIANAQGGCIAHFEKTSTFDVPAAFLDQLSNICPPKTTITELPSEFPLQDVMNVARAVNGPIASSHRSSVSERIFSPRFEI
ncbi:hypothetical protein COOONC_05187 [Cooperia oncophora]